MARGRFERLEQRPLDEEFLGEDILPQPLASSSPEASASRISIIWAE